MKKCENCKFWVIGDQSKKNISNVGNCTWMFPVSDDFYATTEHAPFWAQDMARRTASWEGEKCNVWCLSPTSSLGLKVTPTTALGSKHEPEF